MEAILAGEGFGLPLICRPGASWGAPVEDVPEGSITQAWPEDAGLKPETVTLAGMGVAGLLLTIKRVRFPEASVAA